MGPAAITAPGLAFPAQTAGGITIAGLSGELDIACAPALREQLLGLLRPGASRLVIDMSKVSHCVADHPPRRWSDGDIEVLEALAQIASREVALQASWPRLGRRACCRRGFRKSRRAGRGAVCGRGDKG